MGFTSSRLRTLVDKSVVSKPRRTTNVTLHGGCYQKTCAAVSSIFCAGSDGNAAKILMTDHICNSERSEK